ncbi:MAG TPA: hypothetical protein VKU77_34175 [Streptosporangiaceae bacterium]|nr:hypothetical protein [Streptosporangiaceae bacterium]
MTMLPKKRHGARLLRFGALALMTAAFVPLAISGASAGTIPGPVDFPAGLPGSYTVNQVNAIAVTNQKTVFNVKWNLGEPEGPVVTAINHATALTARCANCTAIAIGFQVVTTTERDLVNLRADNVSTAINKNCTATCTAVADAYQVVVATDTSQPMSFGDLLSKQQLTALNNLRSQFLALPKSGLSLTQIQAECQDLATQAVTILQSADPAAPGPDASVYTGLLPSFSPAVHAMDTAPSGTDLPVVELYKDIQFHPFRG